MILGGRGDRALPVFVDALKETSQHELAERLESHIAGVYNQSPAAIEGLAGSLNIPSEKLTAGKTPAQETHQIKQKCGMENLSDPKNCKPAHPSDVHLTCPVVCSEPSTMLSDVTIPDLIDMNDYSVPVLHHLLTDPFAGHEQYMTEPGENLDVSRHLMSTGGATHNTHTMLPNLLFPTLCSELSGETLGTAEATAGNKSITLQESGV